MKEHKTAYTQSRRNFFSHRQGLVKVAIEDTAVKATHQINDGDSQKFLSRSFKNVGNDDRCNQFRLRKSEVEVVVEAVVWSPKVATSDRQ